MLVPSMTYKEMYDNLAMDYEKIEIKINQLKSKAIKRFRKVHIFPSVEMFSYRIPSSNNLYNIFFYAGSRNCIDNPIVDFYCIFPVEKKKFYVRWIAGGYKHTPASDIVLVRQLHVYTHHFFDRFNERIIKDSKMDTESIACLYFGRNREMIPIKVNKEINRNYDKYGSGGRQAFRVKDGFCFTRSIVEGKMDEGDANNDRIDSLCFVYTTFMNESSMSRVQRHAINNEHLIVLSRSMKNISRMTYRRPFLGIML